MNATSSLLFLVWFLGICMGFYVALVVHRSERVYWNKASKAKRIAMQAARREIERLQSNRCARCEQEV